MGSSVTARSRFVAASDHPGTAIDPLWDLQQLDAAPRFADWVFDQYEAYVRGRVLEVGGGIGTYTARLAAGGAESVAVLEPDPVCAAALEERFAATTAVRVLRAALPAEQAIVGPPGSFDLVVCQNVLEHVADDRAALVAMRTSLRRGGTLALLVPAHPRLWGSLDCVYGHERRYRRAELTELVRAADFDVVDVHSFNLLGMVGWLVSSWLRADRIQPRALRLFDRTVPLWRRIEAVLRPRVGLSVVVIARAR